MIGKEIIEINYERFKISVHPFGRKREYILSEISNLKALEIPYSPLIFSSFSHYFYPPDHFSFDYGFSTIYFGKGIDIPEAKEIVSIIKEQFSKYMKDSKLT